MDLLQKFNNELKKYNLEFIKQREYYEKYKGILKDTESNYEKSYYLWKSADVKLLAKQCREFIDLCIKCENLTKGEN